MARPPLLCEEGTILPHFSALLIRSHLDERPWSMTVYDRPCSRVFPYFGSTPFPSRTKVNSLGGTVGPAGALPGTPPGAGGGAFGSGGSTIPWPPRKATYCFPSSI